MHGLMLVSLVSKWSCALSSIGNSFILDSWGNCSLTSLLSPPPKSTCSLSLAHRVLSWALLGRALGHPTWLEGRGREMSGPYGGRWEGGLSRTK